MKERKKVTKKQIRSTLRALNRTEIFRLYAQSFGEVRRSCLYEWIMSNAPSERIRKSAYSIAYGSDRQGERYPGERKRSFEFYQANPRHCAMGIVRAEFRRGLDKYTRIPYFENNKLRFCNYRYGLSDYNGYVLLYVRDNERFCELLYRVARRYFGLVDNQDRR